MRKIRVRDVSFWRRSLAVCVDCVGLVEQHQYCWLGDRGLLLRLGLHLHVLWYRRHGTRDVGGHSGKRCHEDLFVGCAARQAERTERDCFCSDGDGEGVDEGVG